MPIPEDHELRDSGVEKLQEEFGDEAENLVIESIDTTYHDPDWTAVASVYNNDTSQYIGLLRWSGNGEEVDDPCFERA